MGAIGRIITGGNKNKAKRSPNGQAGHVLRRIHTVKKTGSRQQMVMVLREDHVEEFRDTKGCAVRNECL